MKRLAFAVLVVALLAMAQAGQAVTLQDDWYANIYTIGILAFGEMGQEQVVSGQFTTAAGTYGPFSVWAGNPPGSFQRCITVPSLVEGASSKDGLSLPVFFPLGHGTSIAYLSFSWETDYDARNMYVDLWHTSLDGSSELLWTQRQGALQSGTTHVAFDSTFDGTYYFRVNVVPEPPALASILTAFVGLPMIRRRGSR